MLRTSILLASPLAVTLAAAPALADDATTVHDFAALDRASGATGAGADLAFVFGTGEDSLDGFATRLDLHGQYVHASGFGGYAAIGVSKTFLSSDDPIGDMLADQIDDETGLTALELGGQYRRALRSDLDLIAHVGITLPTASDGIAAFPNFIAQTARINDLVVALPETTALRLGVSPTLRVGAMFARADLGIDIVLDHPATDPMTDLDPVVHANLAVGARTGRLSGALELVTLATTGDVADGEDRFIHAATLGARYDLGRVAPSLSVTTPLDDGGRGEVLAVSAGVAAAF